jgi:transglutaminase-like putative cysteine protease
VIYDIAHTTTYAYATPVTATRGVIRLLPRDDELGQKVISCGIEITPQPQFLSERRDFFGNRLVEAKISAPHVSLRIALKARVEIDRYPAPVSALTPAWEEASRMALASQSLAPFSPAHSLFPSRLVPIDDVVTAYAHKSFSPGRPVLEGAEELMHRIHADFIYDENATHVGTPLAQFFKSRRGVCQDFAHSMIAGLRGIGLAASYVSGYIRTISAGDQPQMEGADASHAWVAVWCGPAFGWAHLDPTNAISICNDHIVVAIGRDYADVSPIDGVIHSAGKQELEVSVDVRPVLNKV